MLDESGVTTVTDPPRTALTRLQAIERHRASWVSGPGDTVGFDAVGMGTADDSGQAELLITSAWSAVRGFHTGRIFLISSGINRSARALAQQGK